jgi:hypothetical protein
VSISIHFYTDLTPFIPLSWQGVPQERGKGLLRGAGAPLQRLLPLMKKSLDKEVTNY